MVASLSVDLPPVSVKTLCVLFCSDSVKSSVSKPAIVPASLCPARTRVFPAVCISTGNEPEFDDTPLTAPVTVALFITTQLLL